jgi:hypothetical protein
LSVLSAVLAVALVAMSIAWWRARDDGSAETDAATSVEPAAGDSPAGDVPESSAPAGDGDQPSPDASTPHGDGGQPIPPATDPGAADPGDAPGDGGGPSGDDPLGDVGKALEDLLGGGLGNLGDLEDQLGQLGDLSPDCLGAGLTDLFGSMLGGEQLSGTLDEQVREIADRVEEQRQLRFDQPVDPVLLPADEFDQRIADMVAKEYPASEADLDARVLAVLGVLPAGTDLLSMQADLLSGQVAGFYDPETGEIVVRDDGDGQLDATEEVTLAHELDHALTDQALGLPDVEADGDTDRNLAGLALIEGDATLLMQQYGLGYVSLMDQLGQLTDPEMAAAQQELDQVPPYLREELMFPYTAGLSYACRLHSDGGWAAVDAAYGRPPASTAEVLFADRAGSEPVEPDAPGELPAPWTVARHDTIGAAQLGWLFAAPGSDESRALADADRLAASWAGGELVLATRGDDSALGLALVDGSVDGSADGTLCTAIDDWYDRSFDDDSRSTTTGDVTFDGSTQAAVLRCDGDQVRLGIAPDLDAATALVD